MAIIRGKSSDGGEHGGAWSAGGSRGKREVAEDGGPQPPRVVGARGRRGHPRFRTTYWEKGRTRTNKRSLSNQIP